MVVEKDGPRPITPLRPGRHTWEPLGHLPEENRSLNHIEGVLEVDLKKAHARSPVDTEGAAEGVCHDFYPTRTPHPKIFSLEGLCDLVLGPDAKALSHEPTKGVTTTEWSNLTDLPLVQSNRHSPG
jgi:hypothetical protein